MVGALLARQRCPGVHHGRRGGTVGFPLPGVSLRVQDDGGTARGQKLYEDYVRDRYHQPADEWAARDLAGRDPALALDQAHGLGRELFAGLRRHVNSAEEGACSWL